MSKLHEKVMRMESQHSNMKIALSNIAKIAHYNDPISEAARWAIVAIATKAVQEAEDE